MYKANLNRSQISRSLNISRSCMSRNIKKFQETGTTVDKKRSGREKTTENDDRVIYREASELIGLNITDVPESSRKILAEKKNVKELFNLYEILHIKTTFGAC